MHPVFHFSTFFLLILMISLKIIQHSNILLNSMVCIKAPLLADNLSKFALQNLRPFSNKFEYT